MSGVWLAHVMNMMVCVCRVAQKCTLHCNIKLVITNTGDHECLATA